MPTYFAHGSPTTVLSEDDLRRALVEAYRAIGPRRKVLAVPPDFTRFNSRAGAITRMTYDHFGPALTDILPALGTHVPMPSHQIRKMYAGVPEDLFRVHDWRNEVVTVGTLEPAFVRQVSDGIYEKPWPAQLNKLIWEGGHDLILSIGQVVPHEVTGMANHAKNLFVGCGGKAGIDESHFVGAAYGMEKMMGRADTPTRRLLNEALKRFCGHLDIVFVLTVVGAAAPGETADPHGLVTRGLFIGSGTDCFEQACKLSLEVNFKLVEEEFDTVVCYLDPEEFHTTWLGNKAVYRTRMAIRTGGELIVLAPGLRGFGEDPGIDALIRKYGYRTTPEIMAAVRTSCCRKASRPSDRTTPEIMAAVRSQPDLAGNLSAAAHLIHGSSEGRFKVTYCTDPAKVSRAEIEGVGYQWAPLDTMLQRFDPSRLTTGWNQVEGRKIYNISNPALGLWAFKGRFQ